MMINKDSILYYGNEGPELRLETALFKLIDFDSKDYWYVDFFHGHHLYEVVIPNNIIERIRNNEVILLLNNSHEAFHDCVDPIYDYFVQKLEIPAQQIILLTESASIKDIVKRVAEQYNQPLINVHWLRIFEYNVSNNTTDLVKPNTLEIKHYDKKFINLNRRWRIHRPIFVALLKLFGLLDKGYVSLASIEGASWTEMWPYIEMALHDSELLNILNNNKDQIMSIPDLYLDTTELHINQADITDSLNFYYENSYFSLVNETNYFTQYGEAIFLSEKVFKPIAKLHPFILITRPHSLAMLRSLGYKTFNGLIDETYDTIVEDNERMLTIIREVKRLSSLEGNELTYFLTKAKEICEYNYNILCDQKQFITVL